MPQESPRAQGLRRGLLSAQPVQLVIEQNRTTGEERT